MKKGEYRVYTAEKKIMHAFIAFALQTTFTSSISKLFPIVQITLLCDHVMQQKVRYQICSYYMTVRFSDFLLICNVVL